MSDPIIAAGPLKLQRPIELSPLIMQIRINAATDPHLIYAPEPGTEPCTYLPNPRHTYGCIVGEALIDLGIPRPLLAELDALALQDHAPMDQVQWGADAVLAVLGHLVTAEALTSPWVCRVQFGQDNGDSWAEAVRDADIEGRRRGWVLA